MTVTIKIEANTQASLVYDNSLTEPIIVTSNSAGLAIFPEVEPDHAYAIIVDGVEILKVEL